VNERKLLESLKQYVGDIELGPGGSLVTLGWMPGTAVAWLRRDARRRGYRLSVMGQDSFPTISITTAAQAKAERLHRIEQARRDDDYYNSPG